jgi:protein-S-isoprenylcysteine O-methyltransferase Ste14
LIDYYNTKIPPPVYALLAAGLMYWLNQHFPIMHGLSAPWLAMFPAALGGALDSWALLHFFRVKTTVNPWTPHKTAHLVIHGPYRFTRNPMYSGLFFLLSAWAIWLGSVSPWLVIPLFVTVINRFQIRPEEEMLRQIFGAEYEAYLGQVNRWFGRRT